MSIHLTPNQRSQTTSGSLGRAIQRENGSRVRGTSLSTVKAERDGKGKRLLSELELWEVSLVTFPMLPEARVAAKADALDDDWRDMAAVFEDARRSLAGR